MDEKIPEVVDRPVGQQNLLFCLVCGRLGSIIIGSHIKFRGLFII